MFVRDAVIGQPYWIRVGNITTYLGELVEKRIIGAGGTGFQEPYYKIKFNTSNEFIMEWDAHIMDKVI